jgi:predicted  nucleic acid-binding Zn ribbon protein
MCDIPFSGSALVGTKVKCPKCKGEWRLVESIQGTKAWVGNGDCVS